MYTYTEKQGKEMQTYNMKSTQGVAAVASLVDLARSAHFDWSLTSDMLMLLSTRPGFTEAMEIDVHTAVYQEAYGLDFSMSEH